jgi:hypothetical protein
MPMRVQIQVRIVSDDETVLSDEVIACFDKGDDQLEEIGLSLDQAKTGAWQTVGVGIWSRVSAMDRLALQ